MKIVIRIESALNIVIKMSSTLVRVHTLYLTNQVDVFDIVDQSWDVQYTKRAPASRNT